MHIEKPAYQQHEEFRNRTQKLAEIRAMGIDPYPAVYRPDKMAKALQDEFAGNEVGSSDDAAAGKTPSFSVAGRLVLFRSMGKNAFGQIQDESGRIQIMFNRDLTKVDGMKEGGELTPIKFIEKKLDLGDIIGVEGHVFRTHVGELTIFAKKLTLLCKTLLPLPDKHSGLADKGTRYRKRWLDLITHHDVLHTFQVRSRVISYVRKFLFEMGFQEVETPILQNIYGGAEAKPFLTHLNALDQQMYLRIAIEISLKKLIVGGMQKIFEIGKVFRNEGLDRTHNPEFTMLECYAAYTDYNDMMVLVEKLFERIALELFGKTEITFSAEEGGNEYTIELKAPWKRMSMEDALRVYAEIDISDLGEMEMAKLLIEKAKIDPKEVKGLPRGALIAMLFEEFAEKHLIQPHHIIDHPIETTPLCKLHRDPALREEGIVERFETFILGHEFCNSYTELNDPELQRTLLEKQAERKAGGDEEASPLDEEFIEAICQGMPPTGGLGIGLDRLAMLFTKSHSIRDVLFFPIMRPED